MDEPAAFWSYVRADDLHENGAIDLLRQLLAGEIQMQTGNDFLIFHDRSDILWGQQWRNRIRAGIESVTILIPVITPRFFQSEGCREEVNLFLARERDLGREDLILPLYYLSSPLMKEGSSDEMGRVLSTRQYFDWRSIRHMDPQSREGRKALAELAGQLVARLGELPTNSSTGSLSVPEDLAAAAADEEPGFLELLATSEEAMPLFLEAVQGIAAQIEVVGAISAETVVRLQHANNKPSPGGAKLTEIRKMTDAFKPVAETISQLSTTYLEQIERVDGGIAALASMAPATAGDERAAAEGLLEALRGLDDEAVDGLRSLQEMADAIGPLLPLSSYSRKVLHSIAQDVTRVADTRPFFARWVKLFEEALAPDALDH